MDAKRHEEDCRWMRRAIDLACQARLADEVPVGAVVVADGKLLAAAGNATRQALDPLAHAEMLAIRAAAKKLGSRYLTGCSLYVTLEPCAMCAGAMVLARVERLIYAASDPKAGACGSLSNFNIPQDSRLNHHVEITAGVLADDAGKLLSEFFQKQRAMGKK